MDKIYIKTVDAEHPSDRRRRLARAIVKTLEDETMEGRMLREEVDMLLRTALPVPVADREDPEFEEA